jgi:hypothetical protein
MHCRRENQTGLMKVPYWLLIFIRYNSTDEQGTKIANILFIVALRIPSARSRDQLALKLRPNVHCGVHIAAKDS